MRRSRLLILMLLSLAFLYGCSFLTMTFTWGPEDTNGTTLQPTLVNGTITFAEGEYDTYAAYRSATYDLTNVQEYNAVLIATRDAIRRSNVYIKTTLYRTREDFLGYTYIEVAGSSKGSGILFQEDNTYFYLLTNSHVIADGGFDAEYDITAFGDQSAVSATLVCEDSSLDLAVLKFPKDGRTGLHLIDYETRLFRKFTTDELVFAVGNPLGLENNVTFGEFHSLTSPDEVGIEDVSFDVIFHSATIDSGSSGGALVDVDGNLIGINSWGTESSDEVSFAIPVFIVYMFLVNNGVIIP